MHASALAPLAVLLAAPLASAAILTVGPSGQFAEIADALAAAQPGDVLIVQPGTYHEFTVDKPVRILGDGSGGVIVTSFGQNGIVVTGIPAGEEAVLSGLDLQANPILAPVQASVHLVDNAGTVVLCDLRVASQFSGMGVAADGCARVLLLDAEILDAGTHGSVAPNAAVSATGSELWIANSTITGEFGASGFAEPGDHGVSVDNASLHVWRSTIRGGKGVSGKGFSVNPAGGDGIRASASSVTLYGGPEGEVRGGNGAPGIFGGHGPGGAGVRLMEGSTASLQQDLTIAGGFDSSGLVQTPAVVLEGGSTSALDAFLFPTLAASADQTAVGGSFDIAVDGHPGGFAVMFLSLETGPTLSLPGVEGLGVLNPGLFFQLTSTVLDPAGSATFPIHVPPFPGLLGATFFFQAAEASAAGLAITNPALVAATS